MFSIKKNDDEIKKEKFKQSTIKAFEDGLYELQGLLADHYPALLAFLDKEVEDHFEQQRWFRIAANLQRAKTLVPDGIEAEAILFALDHIEGAAHMLVLIQQEERDKEDLGES